MFFGTVSLRQYKLIYMQDKRFYNALPEDYKLHWYVIKNVLGRGGFGITYLAIDTNLDRKVAIKEFLPSDLCYRDDTDSVNPMEADSKSQYDWGLERFISEAQTLAKFEHPNIVRVIAVFKENNTGYMVMNYEEGDELQALLNKRKTLEENELIRILFPLLDGLEKIHNAGFIHRDIKPQNIMLRADGSPILIDFGSARQALGGKTKTLTTLVSPGYAPFEQYYSKGDKQGPWTDIYALAATLYRCISGIAPLSAVDRSEGIVHGTGDYFVNTAELGKGKYSEQFLNAIDKGLNFKPEDRPQSIAEWRNDLKGVKQSEQTIKKNEDELPTIKASDKQSIIDTRQIEPKEKKSNMLIYIIGLVVFLAIAFFIQSDKQFLFPYLESLQREESLNNIETIDTLLNNAQDSLNALQLIEPEGHNANFYFNEVLILDPDNEKALDGLDILFISLFEKTKIAINAGDYESAKKYLAKADEIKPKSEIIRLSRKVLDEKLAEQAKLKTEKIERDKLLQKSKQKEEQLSKLFGLAKLNMDEQKLITPQGNNARYHYKQILLLEPNNEKAITGLAMISKTYISKAEEAINSNDYVLAKEYLSIAEETAPGNQDILKEKQELEAKINQYLQEKELKGKQTNKLKELLAGAEKDLGALRLTSPAGNNAFEKYQNVLALDPANKTAQSGIAKIKNKYISLARSEINNGNLEKAHEQLMSAKRISPDSATIANMLHELELLRQNKQKEQQLVQEQQRIEGEKQRLAEEEQRRRDEEQNKKVEALEAEIKRMEAEKAEDQEKLERNKIFSVTINQINNKYQAKGIIPNNVVSDVSALLRNSGFKVTEQQSSSQLDNGSLMDLTFIAKDDSTGKLIQWDAVVSAKYLGNVIWSDKEQKKGKSRELYGVQVNIESIDDLKPAGDSMLRMVEKFISKYRNNWPP